MRRVALVLGSLALVVPVSVAPAVGAAITWPVRLSISSGSSRSVTCVYSGAVLESIVVARPQARARAKWVRSVYRGQSVTYQLVLQGLAAGKWATIGDPSRPVTTVVKRRWKTLSAPANYTTRTGLAKSFDAFRVKQVVTFYKPNGYREGRVAKVLPYYHDGVLVASRCVRRHPQISTLAVPGATIGRSYSVQLVATGVRPLMWSVSAGALPAGLTLSAGGRLSGKVPIQPGTSSFTARVSDINARRTSRTYHLTLAYAAGDIDGDGVDTCRDVAVLDANWGRSPATHSQGDLNGDGKVDYHDLSAVAGHYDGDGVCEQANTDMGTVHDPVAVTGAGQSILTNDVVTVSCRVQTATSGSNPDGWWYRLSDAQWNKQYYAPTDRFHPALMGSSSTSSNYDSNVAVC